MVKSLAICIPESIQCICEKPRLGWVEPSHLQTELTTHRTMLKGQPAAEKCLKENESKNSEENRQYLVYFFEKNAIHS